MIKKTFPVIRIEKGLAHQKTAFIIEHNGNEIKIPMFNFQKEHPDIQQILCNIDEDGKITQNSRTITETFYNEPDKTYLFKVKQRLNKHYELEDPRFCEDTYRLFLPFADSNDKLINGQYIECKIKEIHDERPYLILTDSDPCCIDFLNLQTIFNISSDTDFNDWIHSILKEKFMNEVNNLYEEKDGRWICLFAKKIKHVIHTLLLSDWPNKENILSTLCRSWITTIEHSPFIHNMSEKEYLTYGKDFNSSIEICEDFLDALFSLQRDENISDIITSLNPHFFQYRIERKLRFIVCAFAINKEKFQKEMPSFLALLQAMGENKCCAENTYLSITTILKLHINLVIKNTINILSISSKDTIDIKNCILSLCYLVKILNQKNKESHIYASKIFLLTSLYVTGEKERLTSLKNAYYSLFSDYNPISRYKWEELENIVKSQLYLFYPEIPATQNIEFTYSQNNIVMKITKHNIHLAPRYYNGDYSNFNLGIGLSAKISSKRNLSNPDKDFLEIQNDWRDAMVTIFTSPSSPIEKKTICLQDGDEVDIYVTGIIDEFTAQCKIAGHDEEGTIPFNKLFFNPKPGLNITDFLGTDRSPLLFPAEYHIENGNIIFDANKYKNNLLRDTIRVDDEILCLVISKNVKGLYVCATYHGFFLLINSQGEDIQLYKYITASIEQILANGIVLGKFEEYANASFSSHEAYYKYIHLFNQHVYDGGATLKDFEESQEDIPYKAPENTASKEQIFSMIDIFSRLAVLEKDLKTRYGILYTCQILSRLVEDSRSGEYYPIRLKYTQLLYNFTLNNKLIESELQEFQALLGKWEDTIEMKERKNVLFILSKLGIWRKGNEPDTYLINTQTADCSILEKELAKLVLSSCLLSKFDNRILQERILDEIGNLLNIHIIKHKSIHIGEENHKQEFKTSIVFPPNNGGNENIEQQSDNIIRAILAMMNTDGGILYIGVNDDGNVVGIHNDLAFFSENSSYGESKAKDNFLNHFCCLLTNRLGAINAAQFKYDFKNIEGYTIFQVEIPIIHDSNINLIKVGNTIQKINTI